MIDRLKVGLRVLWRDKGSRYSFVSVYTLIIMWMVSEMHMYREDPSYTIRSNPNNNILIGIYVGSILTCSIRIGLIEYLTEKRKKMYSYLKCAGIRKSEYYGYHILWNCAVSMVLLVPFVLILSYVGRCYDARVVACVVYGCVCNSVYIMCFSIFFYNEITGLNVIGTVNFILSISTSMVSKSVGTTSGGNLMVGISYINPQSMIIVLIEKHVLYEDGPIDHTHYFMMFTILLISYSLLFILLLSCTKNEYGYYSKESVCRKKSKSKGSVSAGPPLDIPTSRIFEMSINRVEEDMDEETGGLDGEVSERRGVRGGEGQREVVLSVRGVKKAYGGNVVLDDISISVHRGEILCLLGANGAGKSTLFNIILDNVQQEEGEVVMSGKRVSFCPQHDVGWDYLTVGEHFYMMQSIDSSISVERIHRVRDITMLDSQWDTLCTNLSGGYKRRLTLALTLLSTNDIVLMDEPTTALDIEIRHNIMKGISAARDELGTTIMYTTHHIEDAENYSDSIVIMSKGRVSLRGSIQDLRNKFNLATILVYDIDSRMYDEIAAYWNRSMMYDEETELKQLGGNIMSIRTRYQTTAEFASHIRHIERDMRLRVDIKYTSLEEVYIMDGVYENYSSIEGIGKVDMNDCWRRITTSERNKGAVTRLWVMVKKSR